MPRARRIGGAITAVALALGSLTGCGVSRPDDTLVIGATAAPATLDLTTNAAAAIPQVLLYNVYETLVKVDDDGSLVGLLARSWTTSPDGTVLTFHLDPSARFASGHRVDSSAVRQSLDRLRSQPSSAVVRAQLAAIREVEAPDPRTVVIRLARRDNFLLHSLAGTAGVILDPSCDDDLARRTAGSGPYRVDAFSPGESVDLVASPRSWHHAGVPKVRFTYYDSPTSQTAALLSGDLDVISDLTTPQALSRFSDRSRFTVLRGTTNAEVVLGMNNATPALADRRVREAILLAIDRRALLQAVWNGQGTLIGSMVPPTDPWYTDLSDTWPHDPARARRLLAEAGHGDGLTLRLRVPTLPYATAAARVLTSDLAQVGIHLVNDELEFPPRWLDVVYTHGDYDLTVVAHVEPRDIVNWANPDYYWHYDNPTFATLVAQARSGPADLADERMRRASELLADDAAGGFLYLMPKITVARAGITGLARNATTQSFDLTAVHREDR